jgi:hypothetical protein
MRLYKNKTKIALNLIPEGKTHPMHLLPLVTQNKIDGKGKISSELLFG